MALLGFLVFIPGVLITIRSREKELKYYGIFLVLPFIASVVALILQMCRKVILFDAMDWFFFGLAIGLLAIIINLFLLVYEINTYGNHRLIPTNKSNEENAV